MHDKDGDIGGTASQRIANGIARLGVAMRHQSWQLAGTRGLTPTQGQVLSVLAGASEPLRLGAVVEALALTAATVSECVNVLAEKDLIKKVRDPQDGRAVRLSLTPQGRREAARACQWCDFLSAAMASLRPEELAVMLRCLTVTMHELQGREQLPPQRMCLNCRHFQPNVGNGNGSSHRCDHFDMSFGDAGLQIDCQKHEPAEGPAAQQIWQTFITPRGRRK